MNIFAQDYINVEVNTFNKEKEKERDKKFKKWKSVFNIKIILINIYIFYCSWYKESEPYFVTKDQPLQLHNFAMTKSISMKYSR